VIRIARRPEPVALRPVRDKRLADAIEAKRDQEAITFGGYEVVKGNVFDMQHRKCCYCEKLHEQAKYRDVEHYRPKARYWWLAWTWENLLFACLDCNREYKRDQFPLAPGCHALEFPQRPPGHEIPLVIDPTDLQIEPTAEIEFRRDRIQGKERWVPYGLTRRGRETIEVCGLDRPSLLDLYVDHVRHVVRPKLDAVIRADKADDSRATFRAWQTAKRALLHPARAFSALSHDAMKVLVSSSLRERHQLQLQPPRPAQ